MIKEIRRLRRLLLDNRVVLVDLMERLMVVRTELIQKMKKTRRRVWECKERESGIQRLYRRSKEQMHRVQIQMVTQDIRMVEGKILSDLQLRKKLQELVDSIMIILSRGLLRMAFRRTTMSVVALKEGMPKVSPTATTVQRFRYPFLAFIVSVPIVYHRH
jgi:hypothetical protein